MQAVLRTDDPNYLANTIASFHIICYDRCNLHRKNDDDMKKLASTVLLLFIQHGVLAQTALAETEQDIPIRYELLPIFIATLFIVIAGLAGILMYQKKRKEHHEEILKNQLMYQQLQESKDTIQIALQSANAGYWEIPFAKENGEYVMHYEEKFAKLFRIGHTRPFTTNGWADYLLPILDPVVYADFYHFLRNFDEKTERVVTNALLKFPDGTKTYITNSAQIGYDKNGRPDKMIGLCVDITERVKALEAANSMSETLLNSMRQMIYVAEIETDELIFINDVMMDAFHVTPDYPGKKYWEVITDSNIASVVAAKEKLDKNPAEAVTWEIYQPYLKKTLSCVARYISWIDGRTVCFRTYFDISDIKKAEQAIQEQLRQQQLMTEISKDFIAMDDEKTLIEKSLQSIGEFLDCYRVVLSLYNKQDDTMANDYEWNNPRIGSGPRPRTAIKFSETQMAYRKIMVEKVPYAIFTDFHRHAHLDADKQLKSLLFVPFFVDGEFFGVLEAMLSDAQAPWTEGNIQLLMMVASTYSMFYSRQHIAENLVQAMEAAESASKAKSAFLSNMSHEIRTPLNAIIGITNIALKDELPKETSGHLQTIKHASDVLLDIINNVLDMSKIEAAKLELVYEYFELNTLIENVYNIVSVRANEKHQQIRFTVAENVPNTYMGDSLRLTQLMTNILYNAIKFSDETFLINMDIGLVSLQDDRACLKIDITDHGVGMNEEQIARLFRPFEQGDNRTVRKFGGTGLGLAISKQIVELMNGSIAIESMPGQGSTFTITVQLSVAKPQGDSPALPGTAPERNFSGKRILLVDDVAINREIVKAILANTGVQMDEAENGRAAAEMFLSNPAAYDLIFMDIQMPELDGYGAAQAIRAADARIPIIAMTAHAFKEDAEKCLAAGMNDHIIKPLDENLLIGKVYQYIDAK